jgi:hypothetical protein
LNVFEGLTRHLLKEIKGVEVDKFLVWPTACNENIRKWQTGHPFRNGGELNEVAQNKEFPVFNAAELVVGIAVQWKLHKKRWCFNRMGKTSTSRCFRNGLCKCNEDGITNHP